jgi:DNA-binding MarR family transcriptional regulator
MKMTQQLVDDFRPFDLRPAQFAALATIEGDPGMTQAELARALAIEPPQLVALLNKLESRGLAARIRCKTDKRSYGIFLSKPGEVLLKELKAVVAKSDIVATATLSAAEREVLLSLLHKIYQSDSID